MSDTKKHETSVYRTTPEKAMEIVWEFLKSLLAVPDLERGTFWHTLPGPIYLREEMRNTHSRSDVSGLCQQLGILRKPKEGVGHPWQIADEALIQDALNLDWVEKCQRTMLRFQKESEIKVSQRDRITVLEDRCAKQAVALADSLKLQQAQKDGFGPETMEQIAALIVQNEKNATRIVELEQAIKKLEEEKTKITPDQALAEAIKKARSSAN